MHISPMRMICGIHLALTHDHFQENKISARANSPGRALYQIIINVVCIARYCPKKGLCITHKGDGVPSEGRCSSVQGSLQGAKMFYPSLLKEDRAHYFHNRAPTSITLWIYRCAGHFPTRNSEYATLFSIFVRRICNRYHT